MANSSYYAKETFESDFFCSICFKVFTDPTLLDCGHTFCRSCLEDQYQSKGRLVCPEIECRVKTRRALGELKRNLTIQRVICNRSNPELRQAQCSKHEEEVSNIYCVTCDLMICLSCVVAEHKGHDVLTRQHMSSKRKELEERHLEKRVDIEDKISAVENRREEIYQCLESVKRQVKRSFRANKERLIEINDSLLDEIRSVQNEYCSKLDDTVTQYRKKMEDMEDAIMEVQDDPATFTEQTKNLEAFLEAPMEVEDPSQLLQEKAKKVCFVEKGNDLKLLGEVKIHANTESVVQTSFWFGVFWKVVAFSICFKTLLLLIWGNEAQ